jgi:hypothetical protein
MPGPGGAEAGGGAITRVVSFFGTAEGAEGMPGDVMRIVWLFGTSGTAGGGVPDAAGSGWEEIGWGGGAGVKRTVSRFTTGGSPALEGSVMRTVSFLGVFSGSGLEAGISEGVSSAILSDFHFLSHCADLMSITESEESKGMWKGVGLRRFKPVNGASMARHRPSASPWAGS